uniref:Uncharacterized protein n=1 Tax=Tanacetum cinerariifolium TaxID=118510 RepID=A0A6L2KCW5_TANCI|nr:hypothetical protein [Tanacetum cinerariifolium]
MNCIKDDRPCFFLPSVPAENDSDGPQSNQQNDLDRPQSNQQNDPEGFYNYERQQTVENDSDRPQSNQQNDLKDQETSPFCNGKTTASQRFSLQAYLTFLILCIHDCRYFQWDEDQETSPFCNGKTTSSQRFSLQAYLTFIILCIHDCRYFQCIIYYVFYTEMFPPPPLPPPPLLPPPTPPSPPPPPTRCWKVVSAIITITTFIFLLKDQLLFAMTIVSTKCVTGYEMDLDVYWVGPIIRW